MSFTKILIVSALILFSDYFLQAQTNKNLKNDFSNSMTYTLFSDWFGNEKVILDQNYFLFNSPQTITFYHTHRDHIGLNYSRLIKDKYFMSFSYNYSRIYLGGLIDTNTKPGFIFNRKIYIIALTCGYSIKISEKPEQKLNLSGGLSYNKFDEEYVIEMVKFGVGWWELQNWGRIYKKIGILIGINYKLYIYKGLNLNFFVNYHNDFSKVYFINTGIGFGYSF